MYPMVVHTLCSFLGLIPLICPPQASVYYFAFTRNNTGQPTRLKLNDDKALNESFVEFNRPTKLYVTGFLGTYTTADSQEVKNAYLQYEDCNVILVDASQIFVGVDLRNGAYFEAQPVAVHVAQFIDYLVTKGLKLVDLELLGTSLGAQVIGLAAPLVKSGKIHKIMAYDPVGLVFNAYPPEKRLDKSDAHLVIVIHTNPNLWGYYSSCGHVDFWINRNNIIQPGCTKFETIFIRRSTNPDDYVSCSHVYSVRIGVYALSHPMAYPARNCSSFLNYANGLCDKNDLQFVGDQVNETADGNYYAKAGIEVYSINP